ncbi:hypothetical protein DV733_09430 [Halapricum salinum]|uniref:DUF8112 domain-containing protein n=1 Tax=Halapricum salinum TaxID=1457250 RepID=A0A4D6HE50_9EURY|nr:hypothetical protein DV733_09430 [Halapricum salinum]
MKDSKLAVQESIDRGLIEDIPQILQIALGEGAGVCQVCGTLLREGRRVAVYAFRACRHTPWQTGQLRCVDHPPSLHSLATVGVREVVAEGRVGRCVDQALQTEWPVLLEPEIREVSPWRSDAVLDVSEFDVAPRTRPTTSSPSTMRARCRWCGPDEAMTTSGGEWR